MKKNLLFSGLLFFSSFSFAQTICGTEQAWQNLLKNLPELQRKVVAAGQQVSSFEKITSIVTIPVVVHVVYNLPGENISNAQILSQIDVLNEDFRRLNADTSSTRNIFKPFAADAQVQFCLAQRDPNGNPTTGITRTQTTVTSWSCTDSMKFTSYGGEDGWPGNEYLNIWVCNLNCANGYAYYPGTPDPYDGVVVHYYVFGRTGNIAAGYNGRTATHEVGHYLGLYHPFDYNLCSGTDSITCAASGDKICDTPANNYPSYGCDTTKNSCTDFPYDYPDQIENFMDYADDACRNMFTAGQVSRMQMMLNTYRTSLQFSLGCIPSGTSYYDAALLEIKQPLPELCSSSINPVVRVGNISTMALTSLTVYSVIDNGIWIPFSWNGIIQAGSSGTISLPTVFLTLGIHTFEAYVTGPNGQVDMNAFNDTLAIAFNVLVAGDGLPYSLFSEGFENPVFPPVGWYLVNPGYDKQWMPSNDAGGFGNSASSALYDNFYNGSTNTKDGLVTPKLDLSNLVSASLHFDVSYSDPNSSFYSDTLKVYYSLDCGLTWNFLWAKGGNQLSTAPAPSSFQPFIPDSSQWRQEVVNLNAAVGNPLVTLMLENVSYWGNELYLDNVNITGTTGLSQPPLPFLISCWWDHSSLFIKWNSSSAPFLMEICDAAGKKLAIKEASSLAKNFIEWNGLSLAPGIYLLKCYSAEGATARKFIVSR